MPEPQGEVAGTAAGARGAPGAKGYELYVLEDAVVARWLDTPTAAAASALREDLTRELSGERRAFWIVIDVETTEPPSSDARTILQDSGKELLRTVDTIDVIILGEGVRAMLMRTVLRGMALITRTTSQLHVHQGVEPALAQRRPSVAVQTLLRSLR